MLRTITVALCACAYLYAFPYQATLNNPNENVRFYMTAALAESGRYEIDALRDRWGWVNDAAVHDGHVYSVKAPGTSELAIPGYLAYARLSQLFGHAFERSEALWVCRLTASILPTLAFAAWFFGFLQRRGYPPTLIIATFVSVLFGSLLYGYGLLLVSHTLSAVVAFVAFAVLYEVQRCERSATPLTAAWAGLTAAATTWFEYPGLVASVVLTVYAGYVLRSWRLRAAYGAAAVLPALLMMHFQWRAFGSPFTPGHLFVETAGLRAAHEQGLYGAVGPSWQALWGLLFDPGAGLFMLTPLLWLALPGTVLLWRDRDTRAAGSVIAALCVLTTLAIASMNNWRGGWTIGPRYLAVCVPFLAWAALHALTRWSQRAPLSAASFGLGAALAACIASGIPSVYYPHLPPEFTRPVSQLFTILIAHDFAPTNLGNRLGVWGTRSMLPVFACWLGACALALHALPAPAWRRAAVGGAACLVAVLLVTPLWVRPSNEPGVREAIAFVTRRFHPPGHDRAAVLHSQLKAAGQAAPPEGWHKLSALYKSEGRDREANLAAAHR
ncbi:MAG: hypothetical protein RL701_1149 [Pseudomonadota bacterium]